MSEEEKSWYFIDEKGNVADFNDFELWISPSDQDFKKVYVVNCLFSPEQRDKASTGKDMVSRGYNVIPANHEIAKYIVEHAVEVDGLPRWVDDTG